MDFELTAEQRLIVGTVRDFVEQELYPHERTNLVGEPESASPVAEFRREVTARWDLATLDREVRQSQQRRLAVGKALGAGVQTPWDFTPAYDASRRYIRNHMDLAELEELARFPPVQRSTRLA